MASLVMVYSWRFAQVGGMRVTYTAHVQPYKMYSILFVEL